MTFKIAGAISASLLALTSPALAQTSTALAPGTVEARNAKAATDAMNGWYGRALLTRDKRLAWWRDARFGAFIHWGAYSVLGGVWKDDKNPGYAEHIMRVDEIPLATYRSQVAAKFRPEKFDAKTWVTMLKAAGMRYIIITAKHHEGFAIWPSKVNGYNIHDVSHFERDPLRELVTAARDAGLKIGFYYSHAFDWEDPDAPGNDWDYDNPGGGRNLHGGRNWWDSDPAFLARTEHYLHSKAIPEIQELIALYHPDIFWFDTPDKLPFYQQAEVVEAVRKAAPDVVINGRAARDGDVNLGDYLDTADRPAEVRPTPGDWEAIPTTNESYGWNKLDPVHHTPHYFIQLLARIAAKGGNMLMNIGPRGDGTIDPPDVSILQGIAKWMQINGESIHGTTRTPLDRQAWGDSTLKGDRLYLHVFDWPRDGKLTIGGLISTPSQAYLLGDPRHAALAVTRVNDRDVAITVPQVAPDADDTVIVLNFDRPPVTGPGRLIAADVPNNRLLAFDAGSIGEGFTYGDGKKSRYYVAGLGASGNELVWNVRTDRPTRFRAKLIYSTEGNADASATLDFGGRTARVALPATKTAETLADADLGTVELKPGELQAMRLTANGTPRIFELDLTPE